jgi:hypothetical protein
MKSRQKIAIARRCLAAVAHACHAMCAGCGWLRRLANAPGPAKLSDRRRRKATGPPIHFITGPFLASVDSALTQGPGAWGVIVMQRLAAILTVDGPTPRRTSWPSEQPGRWDEEGWGRQRLDHSEATPATVGSELQFCDDPQIAHALRDTMPLRMLAGSPGCASNGSPFRPSFPKKAAHPRVQKCR